MNKSIASLHKGNKHGPITRVFSPGDIGEILKPFIFLDYLDAPLHDGFGFGFHPHSGIATLTHQLDADVDYEDTSGQKGIVKARGIEWMKAGGGVWHKGKPTGAAHAHGFQLWVALPAGVEDEPSEGCYLPPEIIEHAGSNKQTRVLTGRYEQAVGHVPTPTDMNYFYVNLNASEDWTFATPSHHDVVWLYVHKGELTINAEKIPSNTLVIFNKDDARAIQVQSTQDDTGFIFGSAQKHPYPLVSGYYSVHTNALSLQKGEAKIEQIGKKHSFLK